LLLLEKEWNDGILEHWVKKKIFVCIVDDLAKGRLTSENQCPVFS